MSTNAQKTAAAETAQRVTDGLITIAPKEGRIIENNSGAFFLDPEGIFSGQARIESRLYNVGIRSNVMTIHDLKGQQVARVKLTDHPKQGELTLAGKSYPVLCESIPFLIDGDSTLQWAVALWTAQGLTRKGSQWFLLSARFSQPITVRPPQGVMAALFNIDSETNDSRDMARMDNAPEEIRHCHELNADDLS